MFTKKDVAEYYNTTQLHYEKWWDLKNSLSLHYGIWGEGINNFPQSITNTNRILMELSNISESDIILDAGCGVGGAALYLNSKKNVRVVGITLSEKQLNFASRLAKDRKLDDKVSFYLMDYTHTSFESETFDVVWACESMSSAQNKLAFINEAYRLLKKGGRLILSDFFLSSETQTDTNYLIKKWIQTWCISGLISCKLFTRELEYQGFTIKEKLAIQKRFIKVQNDFITPH